jgi:hypothetical protein
MANSHEGLAENRAELDLTTDFEEILRAGHSIHLWNTGGSVRIAEILKRGDRMGESGTPKLGYGADATAAEALVRARDSYYKREHEYKEKMTSEDINDADIGYATGAYPDGSYLDLVASRSEISFYLANGDVMAQIPAITFGDGRFAYGRGENMQAAVDDLQQVSGGRAF